eukprot:295242-Chlamydomonas_euryale.AAC.1
MPLGLFHTAAGAVPHCRWGCSTLPLGLLHTAAGAAPHCRWGCSTLLLGLIRPAGRLCMLHQMLSPVRHPMPCTLHAA